MSERRYLPDDFVDKVRHAADIADVISGYTSLKKHGKNYQGCCPFHEDKNPSFSVNPQKEMYTCFSGCEGSGGSGDVFQFVMRKENLSFVQAVEHVAKLYSIQLPEIARFKKDPNQIEREKNLDSLFNLFVGAAESNNEQFTLMMEKLNLDRKRLESQGLKFGFTADMATHINKSYKGEDQKVIYQAQKVGLLNSLGLAPFPDNALAFNLGDGINDGVGLLTADGAFTYMPIRAHNLSDQVFGLTHFMNNAYVKTDGLKQIIGDRVFIAPTPLFCLQMLSAGISNVVAPFHVSSYGLTNFRNRLSRFKTKTYVPVFTYIVDGALSKNKDAVASICQGDLSSLKSVVLLKHSCAEIEQKETISFLHAANANESLEYTLDELPQHKSTVTLKSSIDIIANRLIAHCVDAASIASAEQIFNEKRTEFLSALSHAVNSELDVTLNQEHVLNVILSRLGIKKAELMQHKYPGIDTLSKRRNDAVALILGAAITEPLFASKFASDSIFSAIESLPQILTPNEKLDLAMYCIETFDAKNSPDFNINKHIISFPCLMSPDDVEKQGRIRELVKNILLTKKNESKSIIYIAELALSELEKLNAEISFDLGILQKYQSQAQIEQFKDREIEELQREIIYDINNSILKPGG